MPGNGAQQMKKVVSSRPNDQALLCRTSLVKLWNLLKKTRDPISVGRDEENWLSCIWRSRKNRLEAKTDAGSCPDSWLLSRYRVSAASQWKQKTKWESMIMVKSFCWYRKTTTYGECSTYPNLREACHWTVAMTRGVTSEYSIRLIVTIPTATLGSDTPDCAEDEGHLGPTARQSYWG